MKRTGIILSLATLLLLLAAGAQTQCMDCSDNATKNTTYGDIAIKAELIQYRDASSPDLNVFLGVEEVAINLTNHRMIIITDGREISEPLTGILPICNEMKITVDYGCKMEGNTINLPDSIKIVDERNKPIAIACLNENNFITKLKP